MGLGISVVPLDSYILPQDEPNYKLEYCTRNGKLNTEKLLNIFGVEAYELYNFPRTETLEEIRAKLYSALDKNDELLMIIYKIYKAIK